MKNIILITTLIIAFVAQSQKISVTYSSKVEFPNRPELNINEIWQLNVNNTESIYFPLKKKNDTIMPMETVIEGQTMIVENEFFYNYDIDYRNLATQKNITQSHYHRKKYLITEPLVTTVWEITNETKKIGEYNCRLAITRRIKGYPTKVWFTEDIPVSHGPGNYHGLPGLILEYKIAYKTVVATKINFKYNEPIVTPSKGKVMTREEFEGFKKGSTPKPMRKTNERQEGNQRIEETEVIEVIEHKPEPDNNQ